MSRLNLLPQENTGPFLINNKKQQYANDTVLGRVPSLKNGLTVALNPYTLKNIVTGTTFQKAFEGPKLINTPYGVGYKFGPGWIYDQTDCTTWNYGVTETITYGGLIKVHNNPTNAGRNSYIFSRGQTDNTIYIILLALSTGWGIHNRDVYDTNYFASTDLKPYNRWVSLVGSYRADTNNSNSAYRSTYLNGQLVATYNATWSSSGLYNTNNLIVCIGGFVYSYLALPGEASYGLEMVNPMIWNRELTAAEVAAYHAETIGAVKSGTSYFLPLTTVAAQTRLKRIFGWILG